jgi:hypothetical protein
VKITAEESPISRGEVLFLCHPFRAIGHGLLDLRRRTPQITAEKSNCNAHSSIRETGRWKSGSLSPRKLTAEEFRIRDSDRRPRKCRRTVVGPRFVEFRRRANEITTKQPDLVTSVLLIDRSCLLLHQTRKRDLHSQTYHPCQD